MQAECLGFGTVFVLLTVKTLEINLGFDHKPRRIQSRSLSPAITQGSSSSSLSPLSSPLTPSVFHSELKTWLFDKSFPP